MVLQRDGVDILGHARLPTAYEEFEKCAPVLPSALPCLRAKRQKSKKQKTHKAGMASAAAH